MAELYHVYVPKKVYWDKQTFSSLEEQIDSTKGSATLYIGNMSFFTTETQVHELFSSVGHVKRIIMGLDRNKKTPCGFCFVEYDAKQEAMYAVNYISGTKLDGRVIRCELDAGFREGRQYGRGNSGGQVRDERRSKDDYDAGRGGYGKADIDEAMFAQRPYRRRGRRHGNSFDKPYAKRHRGSSIDEFNGDNHAPSSEVTDRSTAPASEVAPPSPMKDVSKDDAEQNQKDADVNPRFRDD